MTCITALDRRRAGGGLATALALAISAAVAGAGCRRTFEEPASAIEMGDSAAADQLTAGFHGLEAGEWRWTARRFSVNLKPPPEAERRGATLRLNLFIPEEHLEKLGSITLSADAGGYPLEPETYSSGGSFVYVREIPVDELFTSILPINFCLDDALAASEGDGRELGIVVTSVALESP